MPTNPIDETVRNMRLRLVSAGSRLRVVRSNMEMVNVAREGYYPDWALDEMDDVLARLARLAARLPPA